MFDLISISTHIPCAAYWLLEYSAMNRLLLELEKKIVIKFLSVDWNTVCIASNFTTPLPT